MQLDVGKIFAMNVKIPKLRRVKMNKQRCNAGNAEFVVGIMNIKFHKTVDGIGTVHINQLAWNMPRHATVKTWLHQPEKSFSLFVAQVFVQNGENFAVSVNVTAHTDKVGILALERQIMLARNSDAVATPKDQQHDSSQNDNYNKYYFFHKCDSE